MIRILRWFAEYRALEAQLQESASARIIAEDRVREYRAKCEAAEEQRDKAQAENSYLMKAIADHQAIAAGQLPIFNVVPLPPRSEDSERAGPPVGQSVRDIQRRRNIEARKASLAPVEVDAH